MLWTMYVDFFFSSRRRHTRYIGDWSSDVCSSDLVRSQRAGNIRVEPGPNVTCHVGSEPVQLVHPWKHLRDEKIGRASCRERVRKSLVTGTVNKNKVRVGEEKSHLKWLIQVQS